MCLLVVASRVVPGTPVLVGANRDEFLSRPAVSAVVLRADTPRIIGGRDEQSGGTWLAVNQHGVFAGLTNQPLGEERDATKRTRGELPLALASQDTAARSVDHFLDHYSPTDYNGSYLLVGDRDDLFFIDFTGTVEPAALALPPGVHVLENRPLGSSSPKTDHVGTSLGQLTGDVADDLATMRMVLSDHHIADITRERPETSANCVHMDEFGTRSSCIVRVPGEQPSAPQVWVAAGSPCNAPFEDVGHLWQGS
ncbi:MAG TPA: NRDE family protein [Acidimicrobiales bacterium]|nr:NRDE family protein [Acidimicrobiales bacterium]